MKTGIHIEQANQGIYQSLFPPSSEKDKQKQRHVINIIGLHLEPQYLAQ